MPPGNVNEDNVKTILVCGLSGAGKTSFINTATGSNLVVGHGIDSATSEITEEGIPLILLNGIYFQLVDVPGFDDTRDQSDTEIFLKLTAWLADRYRENRRVDGLIYIRPINIPRVTKLEASFIGMFKAICGEENLGHVIFVTNRWNSPPDEGNEELERRLATDVKYFGTNIGGQVKRVRLVGRPTREEAQQVLAPFVHLPPVTLKIQRETIEEGKLAVETEAGTRINDYLKGRVPRLVNQANEAVKRAIEARKKLEEAEKRQLELEKQTILAREKQLEAERDAILARERQLEAERRLQEIMDNDDDDNIFRTFLGAVVSIAGAAMGNPALAAAGVGIAGGR